MAAPAKPDPQFDAARKKLISLLNWTIIDEKHRSLQAIHDSICFLQKIQGNVLQSPDEPKYRKVRITNALFGRHVRDAPGGEEFMRTAGWKVRVVELERYWVFEAAPGSKEWDLLAEAGAELGKSERVVAGKLSRASEDKKQEAEKRREAVRHAMEDDKQQRAVRLQAHAEALVAVQEQREAQSVAEHEETLRAAAEARRLRAQAQRGGGGGGGASPPAEKAE